MLLIRSSSWRQSNHSQLFNQSQNFSKQATRNSDFGHLQDYMASPLRVLRARCRFPESAKPGLAPVPLAKSGLHDIAGLISASPGVQRQAARTAS